MLVHVATPVDVLAARVQVENVPVAPGVPVERDTVPVGVVGPDAVSVTVTLQLEVCAVVMVRGVHATVVPVECAVGRVTVTVALPELVAWLVSPG